MSVMARAWMACGAMVGERNGEDCRDSAIRASFDVGEREVRMRSKNALRARSGRWG